jgi:hypothetical protein
VNGGITTFSVTIASTAGKAPLRLIVEADNWVAAWQQGLAAVGVADLPADAICVVGQQGRVDIDVPSQGRRFTLQQMPASRDAEGPPARLRAGRERADDLRDTVPDAPPVAVPPTTPDPIAKVLSDLQRQRLLARPIRISSKTGLPLVLEPPRAARYATARPEPRPTTPGSGRRRRPTGRTQAFATATGDQLPQEFRPVQQAASPPDDLGPALQWAADTAWQHVPCALALVLSCDEGAHGEVVAARGEREREARGCHVACDSGPTLLPRAPSLTRYPSEQPLHFIALDDATWDLPVGSVLSVPIELPDGELTGLGLVLFNASRPAGFTDSELRAVSYLARTLGARL